MLLWGIIALAAADPASISRAVETAKWAAAGRLTIAYTSQVYDCTLTA